LAKLAPSVETVRLALLANTRRRGTGAGELPRGLVISGIYRELQVVHTKLWASRAFWLLPAI
jgi:hypothetical protein